MLPVSKKYSEMLSEGCQNWQIALYIHHGDVIYILSNQDLMSFELNDSCVSDSFELGGVYAKNITFTVDNYDYSFDEHFEKDDMVDIRIALAEDNVTDIDSIPYGDFMRKGKYYITDIKEIGRTIKVTALDAMDKFNKKYTSSPSEPTYIGLVKDMCSFCGVNVKEDITFLNGDVSIATLLSSAGLYKYTCREILSFIAQKALGYARIDELGYLTIKTFTMPDTGEIELFGGTFQNYSDGDKIEGGNFESRNDSYYIEDEVNGGTFRSDQVHSLTDFYRIEIEKKPRMIKGAVVEIQNENTWYKETPSPSDYLGDVLTITGNPFVRNATSAEIWGKAIYNKFAYKELYQFECSLPCDITREPGDVVVISHPNGKFYVSLILEYTFNPVAGDTIISDFGCEDDNSWSKESEE